MTKKHSQFKTENQSYLGADSGCARATEKLGEQSKCLDCPFRDCVYIDKSVLREYNKVKERQCKAAYNRRVRQG